MFRADRIGTPHILQGVGVDSVLDWTAAVNLKTAAAYVVNVINAAPVLDFAESQLNWNGTEAIPANNKFALVQQFTVSQPRNGTTAGVELIASIRGTFPRSTILIPYLVRMATGLGTLLQGSLGTGQEVHLGDPKILNPDLNTITTWGHHYLTQAVVNAASSELVAGVYGHGFQIIDNSGAGWNLTSFTMDAQVRQLNDQQNIGYRDTRK